MSCVPMRGERNEAMKAVLDDGEGRKPSGRGGSGSPRSCAQETPLLDAAAIRDLLDWFVRHRRHDLPWRRTRADGRRDPWRVWLAEIMLQQTTVATVSARFEDFLARFPDVHALARAGESEVMEAWAGLGYYARARHLHRAAREIVERHAGSFPRSSAAWGRLPGIGPYTAAAIAAIAFGEPVLPVDTNVARVLIRLHAIDRPWPQALAEIRRRAGCFRPPAAVAGDLAEALMDLGSGPCAARAPDCAACPLTAHCAASAKGTADRLPRRAARVARRKVAAVVFCLVAPDGRVLLERRPARGLLGGMWALPMSAPVPREEFRPDPSPGDERWRGFPFSPTVRPVRHLFTHLDLEAHVVWSILRKARELKLRPDERWWAHDEARRVLPTLMRKALDAAWPQATAAMRA